MLPSRYLYWRQALTSYKAMFPDMDQYIERLVASFSANKSNLAVNGPRFCERIHEPSQFTLQ